MKRINSITGIVFIALGVFIIAYSFTFKATLVKDHYTGPEFFPRLIALGMILLSLILIATSRTSGQKTDSKETVRFFSKGMKTPLMTMGMLVVYVSVMLEALGFALSSILLFLALLRLLEVKRTRFYVLAPIFVIVVTALFRYVFLVQLPTGIIGF
ncbi:MAG: tripartite tricarboxylate transporter TctB family protein [Spirochaetia bacterium]|nr:tripartite tricarboxylate transporter TctB family protein [Spirochaetia bacterium]MCF7940601.1 tripartite tricarboxylate transporter TctB family protein [Spirochaetia bacterium]